MRQKRSSIASTHCFRYHEKDQEKRSLHHCIMSVMIIILLIEWEGGGEGRDYLLLLTLNTEG